MAFVSRRQTDSSPSDPTTIPSARIQSRAEEIANSISHGVGALASLIGTPLLLIAASRQPSSGFFFGTFVFLFGLFALYLSSTIYHGSPPSRTKRVFRLLDHCAIYFLIAATYTPFALGPLSQTIGLPLLGVVWALALCGIALKITVGPTGAARLAMALYLGIGWLALLVVRPLFTALPLAAAVWLFAGGFAYTAGVLFFVNDHRRFHHFFWHLFVLAGSACHFCAIFACAK